MGGNLKEKMVEKKKNQQKELHELPNKYHCILIKTQVHIRAIPWHFNFFFFCRF